MKIGLTVLGVAVLGTGIFFVGHMPRVVTILAPVNSDKSTEINNIVLGNISEPTGTTPVAPPPAPLGNKVADLPNQTPLLNPPTIMKGVYLTGWSAGSPKKIQSIVALAQNTEVNTVVIDIKDYSGYVSYYTNLPEVKASGAENQVRIARPNALLKKLHDNNIYVIGRITSFQDPILAVAHPEWALQASSTGKTWMDNHGLAWLDPSAKPVWDYLVSLAKDAFARGFDEVQFDYVRFPSDGVLGDLKYPYWDMKTSRSTVIKHFFEYLRQELAGKKISADLFGLATVERGDLGIGQVIESAYANFDYISPMVYPSHYAAGFLGYKNPANYPYEIITYSLEHALARLVNGEEPIANSSSSATSAAQFAISHLPYAAKLRPWLQVFDLGAVYTPAMVQKEISATQDVLATASSSAYFGGWLLWDPNNLYKSYNNIKN